MKRYSIIVFMFMVTVMLASAAFARSGRIMMFESNLIPQPRLLYPRIDKVDLTGKKELVFRWSPHEGSISKRKYYDFRLYRGYDTYEKNLIIKKQVPPTQYNWNLSTSYFENGKVYTWSLRQKYYTGKSRRSWNSFTVTK